MNKIRIATKNTELTLDMRFLDNPAAAKVRESLPLESRVNTWGDEIYFETGVMAPVQGATMDVAVGDVAYWPEGRCFCVFFGRTPLSTGDKPVPASEVVIIGRVSADPALLRKVKPGSRVIVE